MRTIILGTVLALGAHGADAARYTQITTFGDSLSDTGNIFIAAAAAGIVPNPVGAPYFAGRFSNGPIYLDYLSPALTGSTASTRPALAGGTNYAFGGARAVTNADFSPDLLAQTQLFASRTAVPLDPGALYVVSFANNDVRAQIQGREDAPTSRDAARTITGLVQQLYSLGARNVLVTGSADLGSSPVFFGQEAEARRRSLAFNGVLARTLGAAFGGRAFETGTYDVFPGGRLTYFDTAAWGDMVVSDPAAFGLPADLDLRTPCFSVPSALPDCTGYAWSDTVHPTSSVHLVLGRSIEAALGTSVPEPAMAALFGLGAFAAVVTRRRRWA